MAENQEFVPQETPTPEPQKQSMKGWLIGGCAAIGLLVVAAMVLFVVFDPFGLVALLFGGGDIARIVPDDVVMYAEVDLLSLQSVELVEIIDAFQDAAGDVEEIEPETFEEEMEDEFGITMDDVTPWLGQHLGFALAELQYDQLEGYEPVPVVLIVEVRDKKEADVFIEKVIEYREDEYDEDFDTFEFDGAEFFEGEDEYSPIILGRYKNYMFFAQEVDFLEDVLEMAQEGRRARGKLADLDLYQRTLDELPKEPIFSMYFNTEEILDVYTELLDEMYYELDTVPVEIPQTEAGFGITLSVVEAGLQIDVATVYEDPQAVPWAGMDIDLKNYEPQTPGMVPEETFLFISNYVPEGYYENAFDMLGEDYQEAMELLLEEIDFDFEEIFTSLEGEIAFALYDQNEGFLSEALEIPMGLSILIGINDDGAWDDIFDMLTEEAENSFMAEIDDVDLEGFDLLSLSMGDGYDSYPLIMYGVGDEYALLSTAVENAEILIGDGETLADADKFTQVWESFPEGTWPAVYVDVAGFVEWVEDISDISPMYGLDSSYDYESEVDSSEILEPLTAIAVGSSLYNSSDRQTVTMIFFIDR